MFTCFFSLYLHLFADISILIFATFIFLVEFQKSFLDSQPLGTTQYIQKYFLMWVGIIFLTVSFCIILPATCLQLLIPCSCLWMPTLLQLLNICVDCLSSSLSRRLCFDWIPRLYMMQQKQNFCSLPFFLKKKKRTNFLSFKNNFHKTLFLLLSTFESTLIFTYFEKRK